MSYEFHEGDVVVVTSQECGLGDWGDRRIIETIDDNGCIKSTEDFWCNQPDDHLNFVAHNWAKRDFLAEHRTPKPPKPKYEYVQVDAVWCDSYNILVPVQIWTKLLPGDTVHVDHTTAMGAGCSGPHEVLYRRVEKHVHNFEILVVCECGERKDYSED